MLIGGSFQSLAGVPCSGIAMLVSSDRLAVAPPQLRDLALEIAPNPSRGPLAFRYDLPRAGPVRIDVFDVEGRRVARPLDAIQSAGPHELRWDALDRGHARTAGVYFVRLGTSGRVITRRWVIAN